MKHVLFWIFTVLMIPVYLLMSFFFELSQIVGYSGTLGTVHTVLATLGSFTAIVGAAGLIGGIVCFRKKAGLKKAFLLVSAGLIYGVILLISMLAVEGVYSAQLDKQFDAKEREQYGENWDAPSRIENIPAHYETVLNKYYVIVAEQWDTAAIRATDLYTYSLPQYYGSSGADSIGFSLRDLNADGVDELLIGLVEPVEGGTLLLTVFADPSNPYPVMYSIANESYYLHSGSSGIYLVETCGEYEDGSPIAGSILLEQGTEDQLFNWDYSDLQPDPSGRVTLDLIPFSQYK